LADPQPRPPEYLYRRQASLPQGPCQSIARVALQPLASMRVTGLEFRSARTPAFHHGGPMVNVYDAIVIGGGHNGLVAGAYLARTRAKTVVLEARHKTGGAASSDAPWPEAPEFKVTTY